MTFEPEIRASGPGYTIGVHGGALVLLWHGRASIEGVKAARNLSATDEIQIALVIIEKALPPPSDVQHEVNLWGRDFSPRPVALVYEKDGFAAAAVRTIMIGVQLFTKKRHASQLFSSVATAIDWLKQRSHQVDGIDDLRHYVEILRSPSPRGAASSSAFR
jgi:hypothetical protein